MCKQYELFGGNILATDFACPGGVSTVGVLKPGIYKFGTENNEKISVTSGEILFRNQRDSQWKSYFPFESFQIIKGDIFELKARSTASYISIRFNQDKKSSN